MKHGKSLTELAQELTRQNETKRDFIASTSDMEISPNGKEIVLHNQRGTSDHHAEAFDLTSHAHRQVGTWAGVPAKYYDRMKTEAPELLAENVNHWLEESDADRMLRTLDGKGRAFLSNRYQRIDHYDVASTVLPILSEDPNLKIESCEVTDRRLYIKAVTPRVSGEVGLNDPVQAGVVISNSEIGQGSIKVEPMIFRLVCLNGMILPSAYRKNHVGRKAEESEETYELYQDDTRAADDKAVLLKLRDVTRSAFDELCFGRAVEAFKDTKADKIEGRATRVVEELGNSFMLNDREGEDVLEQLIRGGEMSRFGLINAVTAAAQTQTSYDRSTEMEAMGAKLMQLPATEWQHIAEAA